MFDSFATKSYAQEGEDLILKRIFGEERAVGFFVDVGAHHPKRFSNTYIFYKAGWRGINIEPNPVAQSAFALARPRDITLQVGISDHPGSLTYFEFDDPALNTFDESLMKWRLANTTYAVLQKSSVRVERLDVVLSRVIPLGQQIDFFSIDVEGFDLAVLKSNDWERFRPACVVIEALDATIEGALRGEASLFLQSQGYELFAKTYNSLIFRLRNT